MSFGRAELSLRLSWNKCCALSRREGPEGNFQKKKWSALAIGEWFLHDFNRGHVVREKTWETSEICLSWPSDNECWMILREAIFSRKKTWETSEMLLSWPAGNGFYMFLRGAMFPGNKKIWVSFSNCWTGNHCFLAPPGVSNSWSFAEV